jgi:protease I
MGGKLAILIAHDNFRDEEFNIPFQFFREKDFQITVASNKTGKARGMNGTTVNVSTSIDELVHEEYDVIILVGGTGSDVFWKDEKLHMFLKKANSAKKIIAASYKSPVTLAYAGVLKNKRATVWIEEKDILEDLGAYFTGASIEIDGNIITTDGPHSTKMFVEEIYSMWEKKVGNY